VEELRNRHGITTTESTVMRFFKRAWVRLQEGSKGLPLGFGEIAEEESKPGRDNIPKQSSRERLRAEAASLEKQTKEREAKWKFSSPQEKPARKK
jgi:hypothetical protein